MSSKITRVTIGGLLAVLTAAVGVQSYYLYRVHDQLAGNTAAAERARADAATSHAPKGTRNSGSDPLASPLGSFAWDPIREMQDMRARVDHLFADSLGQLDPDSAFARVDVPRVDLEEGADEYVVRVDLPGAEESSLEVSLDEGSLKIKGDRSEEMREEEPGRYFRRERRVGHFERRLTLPGPVDASSLTSNLADGVLTIRLHKA
jgi:HSP20 family protein